MVKIIFLEVLQLPQQHTADNKQLTLVIATMHLILLFYIEPSSMELLALTVLARRVPVAECGCDVE